MKSRLLPAMAAASFLLLAMTAGGWPRVGSTQELFGSATGLPLPRFVSLVSDRINVRSGPGKEFPIRWVFTREDLPVQIIDESGDWRQIVDYDGDSGWIHTSLLKGDRTILVLGEIRTMYRTPSTQAIVTAMLEPGVVAELLNCEPEFCYIDVDGRRGWLERSQFWGVLEGENP